MTTSSEYTPSKKEADEFKYYVVAMIDILGQKTELAKWSQFPKNENEYKIFLDGIKNSFGRVILLRKDFEENFNLFLSHKFKPSKSIIENTQDGGKSIAEFQETTIQFTHFSDTIVVHAPVANKYRHINSSVLFAYIATCGTLLAANFNRGVAFRGAINIGMAGQLDQEDIYGPVLTSVHRLECKVAQYPRIIIGNQLIEHLRAHTQNPDNSKPAQFNRIIAQQCLDLLCEDYDGNWIIDYLCEAFGKWGSDKAGWKKLQQGGYEFAVAQLNKFKEAGCDKLTKRYERLVSYFHSRGFK